MNENKTPSSTLPLAIRTVYLRKSSTQFGDSFDPLKPGQPLQVQSRFAPIGFIENGDLSAGGNEAIPRSYTFLTEFEFSYLLGPVDTSIPPESVDTSNAAAKVTAQIAVDYLISPSEPVPTAEQLQQWGGSAALMHSWPYWREFAHSTMMRMNLPVVMAPLLVAQPQPVITPVQDAMQSIAPAAKRARSRATAKPLKK